MFVRERLQPSVALLSVALGAGPVSLTAHQQQLLAAIGKIETDHGRGSAPGLCLLVSEAHEASPARARLSAVAATLDGFELSRIDLEQRREGDVLGQAQSGARSSLRMLTVIDDEEIIAEVREEAAAVVAADPSLERHPGLRTALDALLDEEREQYLDKG